MSAFQKLPSLVYCTIYTLITWAKLIVSLTDLRALLDVTKFFFIAHSNITPRTSAEATRVTAVVMHWWVLVRPQTAGSSR